MFINIIELIEKMTRQSQKLDLLKSTKTSALGQAYSMCTCVTVPQWEQMKSLGYKWKPYVRNATLTVFPRAIPK